MKAIVIGSTGATGIELINELIKDSNFTEIITFSRNSLGVNHIKLTEHIIDFNKIKNSKEQIKGDVLFSALGTTKKDAGSKKAQYTVDFTYQYEFAKAANDNGVKTLVLVSSVGANDKSLFFYPKIKGELEKTLKKLDFRNLYIFQPPMLIRQNDKIRKVEKSGIRIINKLNTLGLLRSQKPISVNLLAKKLIKVCIYQEKNRIKTYSPKDIFQL
jgi:uncharacterized protein YbjT (DUF2867 family)